MSDSSRVSLPRHDLAAALDAAALEPESFDVAALLSDAAQALRDAADDQNVMMIHDSSGMGHVYALVVDGIQVWSHASHLEPWPDARGLVSALATFCGSEELSPDNPGFGRRDN